MRRFMASPRRKTYTFLGITLILVLVFLLGAIRPTLATISSLRGEISERESVSEDLQAKINTLQDLQDDYLANQEAIESINYLFPEDSDYSFLMASLEKISRSYGFELITVQVAVDEKSIKTNQSKYSGMNLVQGRVVVIGDRDDLGTLIEHIEDLPMVPNITKVSFSPYDEDDIDAVKASIDFEIYKKSTVISETNE